MITRLLLLLLFELVVTSVSKNDTSNKSGLKETLNPDGSPVDDNNQNPTQKHYHPDGASEIPLIIPENIKRFNSNIPTIFDDVSKNNQTISQNLTSNNKETPGIISNPVNFNLTTLHDFSPPKISNIQQFNQKNDSTSEDLNFDNLDIPESLKKTLISNTVKKLSENLNKKNDSNLNFLKINNQSLTDSPPSSNSLTKPGILNNVISSFNLNQPNKSDNQIISSGKTDNDSSSNISNNVNTEVFKLPSLNSTSSSFLNSDRIGKIIDPKNLTLDDFKIVLNYLKTNGLPQDLPLTSVPKPTTEFKSVSTFSLGGDSNIFSPASSLPSTSSQSNGPIVTSESRANTDPNSIDEKLKFLDSLNKISNGAAIPSPVITPSQIPQAISLTSSSNVIPNPQISPATNNIISKPQASVSISNSVSKPVSPTIVSAKLDPVSFPNSSNGLTPVQTITPAVSSINVVQPQQPLTSGSTQMVIPLRQGDATAAVSVPDDAASLAAMLSGSSTSGAAPSTSGVAAVTIGVSATPGDTATPAVAATPGVSATPGAAAAAIATTVDGTSSALSVSQTSAAGTNPISTDGVVTLTGTDSQPSAIPPAITDGSTNANRDTASSGTGDSAIPQISGVDVICGSEGMRVTVNFTGEFKGVIYSKDHYQDSGCIYVQPNQGLKSYTFEVGMISCGTLSGRGEDGTSYFQNTLVFQNDMEYIDSFDSSRTIRCDWKGSLNKPLTFRPVAVDILDVQTLIFNGDKVLTKLEVLLGSGPFGAPVGPQVINIGDPLSLVISIQSANDVNAIVHDCYAYDSPKSTRPPLLLIDSNGCSSRRRLISSFTTTKISSAFSSSLICYATFRAFKFPDALEVYFLCQLTVCRDNCVSPCSQSALGSQNPGQPPPAPPSPAPTPMPATTLAAATILSSASTVAATGASATTMSSINPPATTMGPASARNFDGDAAKNLAALISQTGNSARSLGLNLQGDNTNQVNAIAPGSSNIAVIPKTQLNFVGGDSGHVDLKSLLAPSQVNGLDLFLSQTSHLQKESKAGASNLPNFNVQTGQIALQQGIISSANSVSANDYNILKPKKDQSLDSLTNEIKKKYSPDQIHQMLMYLKSNPTGRKKRSQDNENSNRTKISLFKKIKVAARTDFYDIENPTYDLQINPNIVCIPKSGFIIGIMFLLLFTFTTSLTTLFLYFRQHRRTIEKYNFDFKQTL